MDWIPVLISFIYVFVILGVAEGLRAALKLPVEFTRKIVHISVGMWAWGTAALFHDKLFAIICPLTFVVLNYVSYKRGLFLAMESNDKSNLGTVYFPIAFVLIILTFFDRNKTLMAAALMPMTWGDSFAAIIGKRFGTHTYRAPGGTRSVEGSLSMLAFGFTGTVLALAWVAPGVPWPVAVAAAGLTAIVTTAVEAISPRGLDNLLVPFVSGIALVIGLPGRLFFG